MKNSNWRTNMKYTLKSLIFAGLVFSAALPLFAVTFNTNEFESSTNCSININLGGDSGVERKQPFFEAGLVNVVNGNLCFTVEDFNVNCKGMNLKFTRTYNSKQNANTYNPLSTGWTHSFNIYVYERAGFGANVMMSDGRIESFTADFSKSDNIANINTGSPIYDKMISVTGSSAVLVRRGLKGDPANSINTTYRLYTKDGKVYDFKKPAALANSVYWLDKITDKNGNVIKMEYNSSWNYYLWRVKAGRSTDTESNYTPVFEILGYDQNRITGVKNCLSQAQVNYSYAISGSTKYQLKYVYYPRYNNPDNNDYAEYDWIADTSTTLSTVKDPRLPAGRRNLKVTNDAYSRVTQIQRNISTNSTPLWSVLTQITYASDSERQMQNAVDIANSVKRGCFLDLSANITSLYDQLNNTVSFTYDSSLNKTMERKDAPGVNDTLYEYDGYGNVTKVTNALGKTTENTYWYSYDMNGDLGATLYSRGSFLVLKTQVKKQNGADYQVTQSTYNTVNGNLLSETGEAGANTLYDYTYGEDGAKTDYGQIRKVSKQIDSSNWAVTRYSYDDTNGIVLTEKKEITGSNDTTVKIYTYDSLFRVIKTSELLSGTDYKYTNTTYLSNSDRIALISMGSGNLTIAAYTWDAGGSKLTETNGAGKTISYIYDMGDRMFSMITPASTGTGLITTAYTYDNASNMTKKTDGKLHDTIYRYDNTGRLYETQDPLGKKVTLGFDSLGNNTSITYYSSTGTTIVTMVYDVLGRLLSTTDTGAGAILNSFVYDDFGNIIAAVSSGTTAISNIYDKQNRLIRSAPQSDVTYYPITDITYDLAGNKKTIKISGIGDANTSEYEYYYTGWLKTVKDKCGFITTYTYNKIGNVSSKTLPNGAVTSYSYDTTFGRTITISAVNGGTTLLRQGYAYDPAGNLEYTYDNTGVLKTTHFVRDNMNRILNAAYTDGTCVTYAYDNAGNRSFVTATGATPVTINYSNNDEIVSITSGANVTNFGYNNLGCMSNKGTTMYGWDAKRRFISSYISSTAAYAYDGLGRRISRTSSAATRNLFYAGNDFAVETDADYDVQAIYAKGFELIGKRDGTGQMYFLYDVLGNTVVSLDASANVLTRFEYDAFGKVRWQSAADARCLNLFQGSTGAEYDTDTGLTFTNSGVYDCSLGLFLTSKQK